MKDDNRNVRSPTCEYFEANENVEKVIATDEEHFPRISVLLYLKSGLGFHFKVKYLEPGKYALTRIYGFGKYQIWECRYNADTNQYFGIKNCGAIAPGYFANLIILNNLETIDINTVYYQGQEVAKNGKLIAKINDIKIDKNIEKKVYNSCHIQKLQSSDFIITPKDKKCRIIDVVAGQLLTNEIIKEIDFSVDNGIDKNNDILKIAVAERHKNTGHIGLGFVHGIGLKKGAIASTVSHDSHNLIIIGTNEADMAAAGNALIESNGGCVIVVDSQIKAIQKLPIAGLMSDKNAIEVAADNENLLKTTLEIGVAKGINPFMLMAFISLSVIPSLKITTLGLVDVNAQKLVDLYVE